MCELCVCVPSVREVGLHHDCHEVAVVGEEVGGRRRISFLICNHLAPRGSCFLRPEYSRSACNASWDLWEEVIAAAALDAAAGTVAPSA